MPKISASRFGSKISLLPNPDKPEPKRKE